MPKLIPLISIVVHRNGKAVRLNPADKKPFDFTDEEVEDIRKVDPDALRKPINEGGTEPAPTPEPTKAAAKPKAGDKSGEDM